MAKKCAAPDSATITSFRVAKSLKDRMDKAIESDETLKHATKPHLIFLRRAIERECESLESS